MTTTPAESDPFFELLTDALRAGPGSEKWSEAVTKLRDGGVQGADEYNLLIRARENIEQGRDFRKVVPGPGFTHKVLEAVAEEGKKRKGIPTATIVAVICGAVILGVIITVIVLMSGSGNGGGGGQQVAIDRLEGMSLPVSIASSTSEPPRGLTMASTRTSTTQGSGSQSGIQLTTAAPLDAGVPAAIECEFAMFPDSTSAIQVFVSDSGSPAAELVCTYSSGRASVDVAGGGQAAAPASVGTAGQPIKVSIRFDREVAIVEAGGRRIFAGAHHLSQTPRVAGVRVGGPVGLKSVSVAQAAAPAGGR